MSDHVVLRAAQAKFLTPRILQFPNLQMMKDCAGTFRLDASGINDVWSERLNFETTRDLLDSLW